MRKVLFIGVLCISFFSLNAQTVLDKSGILPRSGDRIKKQEVHYFPCGEAGNGQIWEFDRLEPIEEEYELVYGGNDSLLTGTEHRTRYTYRIQGDSLWKTGVENFATYQEALFPELLKVYPVRMGDRWESYFGYAGEHQHAYGMELLGKTTVSVDASGVLVIVGDTVPDVLRVHTQRKFVQDLHLVNERILKEDSAEWLRKFSPDTIFCRLHNDTLVTQTDTYCWYASGYRYPILETVENTLIRYGVPASHFRTAFYYSPVDQYYTLDEDTENRQKREEAESRKEQAKAAARQQTDKNSSRQAANEDSFRGGSFRLEDALGECEFYQEGDGLTVVYLLRASCEVEMALYTVKGELVAFYPKKTLSPGQYREIVPLDLSLLQHYVLRLVVNGKVYGEKI